MLPLLDMVKEKEGEQRDMNWGHSVLGFSVHHFGTELQFTRVRFPTNVSRFKMMCLRLLCNLNEGRHEHFEYAEVSTKDSSLTQGENTPLCNV